MTHPHGSRHHSLFDARRHAGNSGIAEPIDGFPPLAEILGEIGATLSVLLGFAVVANMVLSALRIG